MRLAGTSHLGCIFYALGRAQSVGNRSLTAHSAATLLPSSRCLATGLQSLPCQLLPPSFQPRVVARSEPRVFFSSRSSAPAAEAAPLPPAPPPNLYADQNNTWIDRRVAPWLQPYLKLIRLDRPIGTYLVLLPGLWGLALAAAPGCFPDLWLGGLFTVGAFVMRGAGCTINDIWDRRFDGMVARTAQRPLASNRLSLLQAWTFLGGQLSLGLGILLQLNWPTIQLGVLCVPLVMVYPALKRFTHLPQVALGLAMNYGVLMGATAVGGPVDWAAALPLYAGAVCWTIVYDTIYAHQDRMDDAKLGLKSTALLFGSSSVPILSAFALASGALWTAAGTAAGLALPYFGGVAASTLHMLWQVHSADYEDRTSLTRRFVSNQAVGWLMLAGTAAGRVLQA